MNILKLGLLLFAANLFLDGFSQLNNFDLSTFKLPDLERRSLETNINISGNNHYGKYPSSFYGYRQGATNQYNGNISLDYNHFLNNTKYQRESNFGLAFSSYFSNQKEDKELTYKNNNIAPVFYFQRHSRKYFDQKSFLETDLVSNYQYIRSDALTRETNSRSYYKYNRQANTLFVQAPVKFGNGRIEQVQDARQAVYIYKELSKADRMSPDKTDEQILEFAKLISQLKNKRFFDSRLRRIAEIESVDSFFTAKNYIKESDATYFTTLNDYWEYGNGPVRSSGTRFSVALLPGYYFYDYNNNQSDPAYYRLIKYSLSALSFAGGMEFKHEKPINLYWQNSLDLNCYFGIIEGKLNQKTYSVKNTIRIPNIQLGLFQTIGFYPNTRTDVSIGYSIQYVQFFDKTDLQNDIVGEEGKGAKAATNISVNYYISPKFRLNIASSFYYIWQDSKDNVIINFDNVAESNYVSIFQSTAYSTYDYMGKEISNNFMISLIYSFF